MRRPNRTWFAAHEVAGVAIAIPPLERGDLPAWIAARLSRNGQRATNDVLKFLADLTEGNLLAAQQEIDKLALLLPARELSQEAIEAVVANVARYENAGLSEALLSADTVRVCRMLAGLHAEGSLCSGRSATAPTPCSRSRRRCARASARTAHCAMRGSGVNARPRWNARRGGSTAARYRRCSPTWRGWIGSARGSARGGVGRGARVRAAVHRHAVGAPSVRADGLLDRLLAIAGDRGIDTTKRPTREQAHDCKMLRKAGV